MVPMVWSVVTWPPVEIAISDICGGRALTHRRLVRGSCCWAVLICSAHSDPQSSTNARDKSHDAKWHVTGLPGLLANYEPAPPCMIIAIDYRCLRAGEPQMRDEAVPQCVRWDPCVVLAS
jgi:hypothetical protein